MKLVATKLELETVGKMSRLVIDNVAAIASDLTVLDSRLLLGNANIDVVALDGTGSLVLIAIDRTSDELLLLKAVEAYSWCLEYPEAVRRLYPAADVSVARPPRVMFVVERMSDSFHRKVKQLGFPEVDCVEFRHLAIDGAEAVHFDTIVRLRRAALISEDTRPVAPVAAPLAEPAPARDQTEPDAGTVARATSVKLQKLLTSDTPAPAAPRPVVERPAVPTTLGGPAPGREPGVVVSMMNRAGRHAALRLEEAPVMISPQAGIAPAAKPPVIPAATRRPVRDVERAVEPVGTLSLEPAEIVAPTLDLLVEPRPVAAPVIEPVVVPEPLVVPEPVAATAPVVVPEPLVVPAPGVVPEPLVVPEAAPVLELTVEPEPIPAPVAVAAPALEPAGDPQPMVAPEPDEAAPAIALVEEPVTAAAPPMVEPVVAPPEPVRAAAAPEPPRISFADLSKELLASQAVTRPPAVTPKSVAPTRPVEPPASIKPAMAAGDAERLSLADLSKELLGAAAPVRKPQANGPTPMRLEIPPAPEPAQAVEVTRSILEQIDSAEAEPVAAVREIAPVVEAAPAPALTVASLVEAAAQAVAPAATEAPQEPKAAALPQEFQGLKFPGDGVLTRQWMDFLNQMTAAK